MGYADFLYLLAATIWPNFVLLHPYIIIDTIYLLTSPDEMNNIMRRNQVLMHHAATMVLLCGCTKHQLEDFTMPIVWSSLVVMYNRLVPRVYCFEKLGALIWFFFRLVYFPWIFSVHRANMHYLQQVAAVNIYMLSLTWTFEVFDIKIRPLVCTLVSAFVPILLVSGGYLWYHTLFVVMSSILHHVWYHLGNEWHVLDLIMTNSYIVHVTITNQSPFYWFCLLMVDWCDRLNNNRYLDRGWFNLKPHLTHMSMHIWFGWGVYYNLTN